MTATQTPRRREPCSTPRRRTSIRDARSWRGINDGSFLRQIGTISNHVASKSNSQARGMTYEWPK